METELERMVVRLVGDGSSYQSMIADAQSSTVKAGKMLDSSTQAAKRFDSTLSNMAVRDWGRSMLQNVLPLVGGMTLLANAFKGVSLAAEFEKNEISFGTMLQDMEKGKALVRELQDFAAATPLNTADIQRAAKLLLQFGAEAQTLIPTLRMLGDVTGGDAQRFQMMSLAFGQMSASGRLMGQDLMQMINAGFNPLKEMSRTTGKSMLDLKAQMEKGGITLAMVNQAFVSATSAGGQFFGLMEKQSKSISGLFSTMGDDIDAFLRTVGFDIIEALKLKDVMMAISSAAQFATEMIKMIPPEVKQIATVIAAVIGAMVAFDLIWPALSAVALPVITALAAAIGTILSPIGLIVVAVAALSAAWVHHLGGIGKAWGVLKDAAAAFWHWIEPTAFEVVEFLKSQWVTAKTAAINVWESTKTTINDFVTWVKPAIIAGVGYILQAWRSVKLGAIAAWEFVLGVSQAVWARIGPVVYAGIALISDAWDYIKETVTETWESVKTTTSDFVNWLQPVINDGIAIVQLLWAFIEEGSAEAWQFVEDNAVPAWTAVSDTVEEVYQSIVDLYSISIGWAQEFAAENRGAIIAVIAVAAALGVAYGAFKLVMVGVAALSALWGVLSSIQGVSTVLWIAWKVAAIVASGVMAIFNVQMGIWNFSVWAGVTAAGGWSAAVLVAKAATWLWNAALTALNVLLAPAFLIAVAGTILVIAAGFVALAGAVAVVYAGVMATVRAGEVLYDTLASLPTNVGPIAVIIAIFNEWKDVIGMIVRAAKVDIPLAVQIAQAGFALALAQVKSLWPPLWSFIKAGSASTWTIISTEFEIAFENAWNRIIVWMGTQWDRFIARVTTGTSGLATDIATWFAEGGLVGGLLPMRQRRLDREAAAAAPGINAEIRAQETLAATRDYTINLERERIRVMVNGFQRVETAEEAAARATLARLGVQLDVAENIARINEMAMSGLSIVTGGRTDDEDPFARRWRQMVDDARQAGTTAGLGLGQNLNAAVAKEMAKFDATTRFGAESLSRINTYLERIRNPRTPATGAGVGGAAGHGAAGAGGAGIGGLGINVNAHLGIGGMGQIPPNAANIPGGGQHPPAVQVPAVIRPPAIPQLPVVPPVNVQMRLIPPAVVPAIDQIVAVSRTVDIQMRLIPPRTVPAIDHIFTVPTVHNIQMRLIPPAVVPSITQIVAVPAVHNIQMRLIPPRIVPALDQIFTLPVVHNVQMRLIPPAVVPAVDQVHTVPRVHNIQMTLIPPTTVPALGQIFALPTVHNVQMRLVPPLTMPAMEVHEVQMRLIAPVVDDQLRDVIRFHDIQMQLLPPVGVPDLTQIAAAQRVDIESLLRQPSEDNWSEFRRDVFATMGGYHPVGVDTRLRQPDADNWSEFRRDVFVTMDGYFPVGVDTRLRQPNLDNWVDFRREIVASMANNVSPLSIATSLLQPSLETWVDFRRTIVASMTGGIASLGVATHLRQPSLEDLVEFAREIHRFDIPDINVGAVLVYRADPDFDNVEQRIMVAIEDARHDDQRLDKILDVLVKSEKHLNKIEKKPPTLVVAASFRG